MTPRLLLLTAAVLLATAIPSAAQPDTRFGIRAGVSGNPDQFVFGVHLDTRPIIEERLTFRPNVEIGVGDHVTTVALNVEFAYWLPIEDTPWWVYLGGGPAANIYRVRRGGPNGDSDVRGGLNILVGLQHSEGLFTELKVGAIDSPEIKFTVGYAFR